MVQLTVNIAIMQNGYVLLMKREDFEVWCLPGGGVDDGESVAQAAVREAREETGLDVELTRLVGIYTAPRWWFPGTQVVVFAARPTGGELQPQPGEVIDIGYFDPHALPEPLLLGQRQRIADAVGGVSGIVSVRDSVWPFEHGMTREELYALRDRSGLSRQQFYLQFIDNVTENETVEVPGNLRLSNP